MALLWQQPLNLDIPPHPAADILSEEELSSAVDRPEEWDALKAQCYIILSKYQPREAINDDTETFLQQVIQHLPKAGQVVFMKEIVALSHDHDKLRQLRNFFVDAVLKPLKACRPPTGGISPSPHPEAHFEIEELMRDIESSSRNDQAKLKEACLRRDGFRCAITGVPDVVSVQKGRIQEAGEYPKYTECSHILPFMLRSFDGDRSREVLQKATIWWALYRYFPALKGAISSDTINQPRNTITMDQHIHQLWGNFHLTLEPTLSANRYRVHNFSGISIAHPDIVTFTATNEPLVPLPSEDYIRVHFAVASILHVSGIGAKIDGSQWQVLDGPTSIKADGSTDLGLILARRFLTDI